MKILVSNDDGYLAPGLRVLVDFLRPIAQITVFAPESNRSGCSNALTLDRPLSVHRADNGFYFANGTPADCVHIALTGFLDFQPDLIVSGINQGQNMGNDTVYSGTVAAATEGFLFGISAMAFSQVHRGWVELASAARVARNMVERHFSHFSHRIHPYVLNINIPNLPYEQIKPPCATRLGAREKAAPVIKTNDRLGQDIYWIGTAGSVKDATPGTDFHAIEHNHVSVTPLQINSTQTAQLILLKAALT